MQICSKSNANLSQIASKSEFPTTLQKIGANKMPKSCLLVFYLWIVVSMSLLLVNCRVYDIDVCKMSCLKVSCLWTV